ncbi:MAG: hypothetical protein IPK99_08280 [Flavobacteriales bacterium]|nr:hypothetical protein [Flavobacteriales bacterium]
MGSFDGNDLSALIKLGGAGQIFTALVYPYIRHAVFNWYADVKKLTPLNQEIAKTYGRYIVGLNFAFGLICVLFADALRDGSELAVALTGLIAAYWVGKVITQFAYSPMYRIPSRPLFRWGGYGMNALFGFFAILFTFVFVRNLMSHYGS